MASVETSNETPSGSSAERSTGSNLQDNKNIYLRDMEIGIRQDLCDRINRSGCFEALCEQMGYPKVEVEKIMIRSNKNPANDLLELWDIQNHTVTELFILLYRIRQYPAMDCIRDMVDERYLPLIQRSQPDLAALLSRQSISRDTTPGQNSSKPKNINTEKIINGPQISRENNESESNPATKEKVSDDLKRPHGFDNVNELTSIPQIHYAELTLATDNWSEKYVLGKGGFGTVFKGDWKYTAVAIKRIEYRGRHPDKNAMVQIQQSLNELKFLNSCRHDNILPLYGFSTDGPKPCLVYQLMAGGSLESRLSGKNEPLNLRQRLNIAIGTARGLQYLHTFNQKPLIHGDIKPANILLDTCNQPRIGDFGLAREGLYNSPMEVSSVYGTKPYLPAEFLQYNALSTKVDVYSFGVVLFELATGLRAYDKERGPSNAFLTKYIRACAEKAKQDPTIMDDLIDKRFVRSQFINLLFLYMMRLGLSCTSDKPHERPEMVMVLQYLAQYLQHSIDKFGQQY